MVRVYLKEAWALLSPPFLDSAVIQLEFLKEKEPEDRGSACDEGRERAVALKGKGMVVFNFI